MGVFPLHCTAHQGFYVQRWHCYGQNTDLTGRQMNTYSSVCSHKGKLQIHNLSLKKNKQTIQNIVDLVVLPSSCEAGIYQAY